MTEARRRLQKFMDNVDPEVAGLGFLADLRALLAEVSIPREHVETITMALKFALNYGSNEVANRTALDALRQGKGGE